MTKQWMIYGANGYTGELCIKEALKRGHKPLIAGRNAAKIKPLAERFQLEYAVVDLNNTQELEALVAPMDLVFHIAGPYVVTAEPMMQACINQGTHYVDLSGEGDVFERSFALDEQAKAAGMAMVCGIGFDVLPTDCLMAFAANQVGDATSVEIAIDPIFRPSPGTAKSSLGVLTAGVAKIRRDSELQEVKLGSLTKTVRFPSGSKNVTVAPIADTIAGFYSTGARNLTAYIATPSLASAALKYSLPLIKLTLSSKYIRSTLDKLIDKCINGPDEAFQATGGTEIWVEAQNARGKRCEYGLKTSEVYLLTSQVSIRFIERLLANDTTGAIAPAQIFTMQDLLAIDGISLFDSQQQRIGLNDTIKDKQASTS